MKLSDGEKLILLMLSEIHQKLKIENGVDAKLVESAILSGNLWGLKSEFPGIFHDSEPAPETVREVVDILDMWSLIERAYQSLSPGDKAQVKEETAPFGEHVKFTGFDGNTEAAHINIARFVIERLNRFSEFEGRELDSHLPFSLAASRRMLTVFKPIRESLTDSDLSATQIIQILKERVHPENQKAARLN